MLCFIFRWKISRALDTGKPLSRQAKRHLVGCKACREFSRFGQGLERRLSDDAAPLYREARPQLAEKVRRAIGEAGIAPVPHLPRPGRRALKPAFAAAFALALIGIGLFWVVRSRPSGMPPLDPLLKIEGRRAYLLSAVEKAVSPYHEEIREFKKTLQSTADYLASRFDIKLGNGTK